MAGTQLKDIVQLVLGERCHINVGGREVHAVVDMITPEGRIWLLMYNEPEFELLRLQKQLSLELQAKDAVYNVDVEIESSTLDHLEDGRPRPRIMVAPIPTSTIHRVQRRSNFRVRTTIEFRFLPRPYPEPLPQTTTQLKSQLRGSPKDVDVLTRVARTVDLSAGGMLMETSEELVAKGELVVMLPIDDLQIIQACMVMRVSDLSTARTRTFRAALAFFGEDSRERDALVRFLMHEEMKRRQQRL